MCSASTFRKRIFISKPAPQSIITPPTTLARGTHRIYMSDALTNDGGEDKFWAKLLPINCGCNYMIQATLLLIGILSHTEIKCAGASMQLKRPFPQRN